MGETQEEIHPEQRQSYILGATWKLIQERQIARQTGNTEGESILSRVIKVKANQDKMKANVATLGRAGSLK